MTRTVNSHHVLLTLAGLAAVFVGCGSADMGATAGGSQDNGLADSQISRGQVPKPEAFTVEGLLNSYDLPLDDHPCDRELCIDAAYGIAPVLVAGGASVFVQLGFSSGISPATFHRQKLNLAVVVDRSGSMEGPKMSAVKQAITRLIDRLGEGDRLSIVLFDDRVDVLVEPTLVTNPSALKAAIDRIEIGNATDMAAGLRKGTDLLLPYAGQAGVSDRIIVFTDANTNTGSTDQQTFIDLAASNAARGIGLTLFGVGTDLNQDLVLHIANQTGGNYVFLKGSSDIAEVFDADFDYLVTPLAYGLHFNLVPAAGFVISAVYGFPSWRTGSSTVEFEIPTVFLSRNHGAIVVRLDPVARAWPGGTCPLAELSMTYTPTSGGTLVTQTLEAAYAETAPLADDTIYYSQRPVRKSVALVNAALAEARASGYYWASPRDVSSATSLLEQARTLLLTEATLLDDADLRAEADSVQRLERNMTYGGGYDSGTSTGAAACNLGGGRARSGWGLWMVSVLSLVALRLRRCA